MSGGSFNYLHTRDVTDLLRDGSGDLSHMVGELMELGYASDVAEDTAAILRDVRRTEDRLQTKIKRLAPVWRAMEWWRSCDISQADFKASLADYRGTYLPPCNACGGTGYYEGSLACSNPNCSHGKDVTRVPETEGCTVQQSREVLRSTLDRIAMRLASEGAAGIQGAINDALVALDRTAEDS
jgi:hypothetical protein